MNKQELIKNLASIGMQPGRGLGQNFLLDKNLLDWIVRTSAPEKGENILEVGPGFGALTTLMLDSGAQVTAIEFDHRIAEYLRKNIQQSNFNLIEADACKVDYSLLFPPKTKFRAIANLPYAISTVFLARLLELDNPPAGCFFMLQREMGERLAAQPGSKEYGALSVRTQLVYQVKIEKIVPAEVFCPPPKVESALVSFVIHKKPLCSPEIAKRVSTITRLAFNQRRKQLGKVLTQNFSREQVETSFAKLGIPWEIRPDRLSVDDFIKLTQYLDATDTTIVNEFVN